MFMSGWMGVDLAAYGLDEPIGNVDSNAILSAVKAFQFIEYVVPVLTARVAYQSEYAPGTLRNKLLGRGDRLPDEHRGSRYRVGGPASTIVDRPSTMPSSSSSTASRPTASR